MAVERTWGPCCAIYFLAVAGSRPSEWCRPAVHIGRLVRHPKSSSLKRWGGPELTGPLTEGLTHDRLVPGMMFFCPLRREPISTLG